jgi:hypothetical protein
MLRLLSVEATLTIEVLFILDFYLLFPFLLRMASMPEGVRAQFRQLRLEKYQDQFLQIPSPQSLYRDLAVIQKTSLVGLAARGLLDPAAYQKGTAQLNVESVPTELSRRIADANQDDDALVSFLVKQFAALGLSGPRGLRNLTGLIRRRAES